MRTVLVALLLLLAAATLATAQLALPGPLAGAAPPDTAAALSRLFATRRGRGSLVVVSTLGAGLVGVAVVSSRPPAATGGGSGYGSLVSGPLLNDQALKAFRVGVATVPVVLVELVVFGGWCRKREQRTIEAWRQHRLPRYFRRKLTARYFLPVPRSPGPNSEHHCLDLFTP